MSREKLTGSATSGEADSATHANSSRIREEEEEEEEPSDARALSSPVFLPSRSSRPSRFNIFLECRVVVVRNRLRASTPRHRGSESSRGNSMIEQELVAVQEDPANVLETDNANVERCRE